DVARDPRVLGAPASSRLPYTTLFRSSLGQWGLQLSVDGLWHSVWADRRLPLGRWVHVACTFEKDAGVSLYLDGERVTSAAVLMEIGKHTSELQSRENLGCGLLPETKN